jgi:hypothetical protein
MPLIAPAKDHARESHVKEITGWQVCPKILDEDFRYYQKLLDSAEVEPPPFTLQNLPTLRAAPCISGQKRGGGRLDDDKVEVTGTSGGGTQHPVPLDGQEEIYTTLSPTKPAAAATISREEAMATFLEAPFLISASHMRVDHIPVLLALLVEDPLRSAAMRLLCKSYTPEVFSYIWSQWEPHIQLSSSHPLAEGALARDHILAML